MLLLVLLAMAVPLIWLIGDAIGERRRDADTAARGVVSAARAASQSTAATIETVRRFLEMLAEQSAMPAWQTELCPGLLATATLGVPEVAAVGLTDATGRTRCMIPASQPMPGVADRAWFAALRTGSGFIVSDRFRSHVSGRAVITIAVPVTGEQGEFGGAAFAQIDLAQLRQNWDTRSLPPQSFMGLVSRNGRLIAAANSSATNAASPPAGIVAGRLGAGEATFEARGTDGVRRIYTVAALSADASETFLLLARPRGQLFGAGTGELVVRLAGLFAALAAALAVVWFAQQRLVLSGVQRLHETALAFAQGMREARVGDLYGSAPEIAQLGQVVDGLIETVNFQQQDLEVALDQKTALLREVHHRVKNNLQIIISMLNLQARSVGDPQLEQALAEAAGRVNALAIVHRRLYESHDLDRVDLDWFLRDLVAELQRIARPERQQIHIESRNSHGFVTAQLAVPIGLLVTEAVTNALKYAFVGRDRGNVHIEVSALNETEAVLAVCDDGVGLAAGRRTTGLGIRLMEGFAQQLEGTLQLESNNGTSLRVVFPRRLLQSAEGAPATAAGEVVEPRVPSTSRD